MIEFPQNPVINGKEIPFDLFVTGEEKVLGGGSGETPSPEDGEKWFVPIGVLQNKITLEEAIAARSHACKKGEVIRCSAGHALGLPGERIALSLEEIDPISGQTIDKPQALGIWIAGRNGQSGRIQPVDERDLNKDFWAWFRVAQKEEPWYLQFPIREDKDNSPEGQKPSSLEAK